MIVFIKIAYYCLFVGSKAKLDFSSNLLEIFLLPPKFIDKKIIYAQKKIQSSDFTYYTNGR
ncbi:Hypothetical protein ETA_pET460270 (plasmid) [Erwinia tasmaniensis Et1/99]|uniref:Uncharacterized protein n=1 Tax=Erwinia tasmaniensis (strain DSM 17950 / CFBP 7177 / CIP 109463 / NCPPB 4357 / Et1/99) TaxID=465817 RepID=B2VB90_ERWT9|nr:Hypothetical protein ETA_pET460270 [Erwinia tasmaniensis Et1/99]